MKLCCRMLQGWGCGECEFVMLDVLVYGVGIFFIMGVMLLYDGWFVFVLEKYCGDLCNFIDF